ncbi:MAG: hypothetical protein ACRD16_09680 [Thermoanaerobaculia bacterium]
MSKRRWLPWLSFLLPFALYIVPHRYHSTGDSVPAELLPISILREHNLDFDEFLKSDSPIPYYFTVVKGRVVSSYPILPGILNTPAYFVADRFGVDLLKDRRRISLVTAALLASLSVLFVFLALRECVARETTALGFALLYAFGTTAWSTGGMTLFQHGASLLLLSAAIFGLLRETGFGVSAAGFLLSLAVVNRPTNIVYALPLTVFVAVHYRKRLAAFLAFAALPAAALAGYCLAYWGTLRTLGQQQGGWGFTGSPLQTLPGLLLSPARGLFVFSPFLIVGFAFGTRSLIRREERPIFRWLFLSVLLLLLLYSWWGMWWGGNAYGYRLITETLPALMLLSALGWERWVSPHPGRRKAFLAMAVFSVYAEMIAVWGYPYDFEINIDREQSRLWDVRKGPIPIGTAILARRLGIPVPVPRVDHTSPVVPAAADRAIEYRVWWSPKLDDDSIPGWYDSPTPNTRVRGPLVVDGWAKAETDEVDVRVILDNGKSVAVPARYPRPDVARALPRLGDCSKAGFRASFDAPRDTREHTVDIELRAPSGRARRLPTIHVTWGP